MEFLEIKNKFIDLLKDKSPCSGEYRKVLASETQEGLLEIIKDNLNWCSEKKVCPDFFLNMFDASVLIKFGIVNNGENNIGLANTGDSNTGNSNTGDWNTGNWNTGYSNTGDWNTGNWNTGNRNTGDRNTGNRNTGDRNTGYRNTGNWNTGDSNTGNSNTGDWNTGNWNTGYSNTGNRNTGAFCTGEAPFPMFNKQCGWTEADWLNSEAYKTMCSCINTKMWIYENSMTEEEKEKHPSYKTIGGFLKDIPFKEAFTNAWHNFDENKRKAFTSLPNFDPVIFEEITGVKC